MPYEDACVVPASELNREHWHRWRVGGRFVEIRTIVCPADDWPDYDESRSPEWSAWRVGDIVTAVRCPIEAIRAPGGCSVPLDGKPYTGHLEWDRAGRTVRSRLVVCCRGDWPRIKRRLAKDDRRRWATCRMGPMLVAVRFPAIKKRITRRPAAPAIPADRLDLGRRFRWPMPDGEN